MAFQRQIFYTRQLYVTTRIIIPQTGEIKEQDISNPWKEVNEPIDFNQEVLETYLREFSMVEVRPEVAEVIKKVEEYKRRLYVRNLGVGEQKKKKTK